MAEESLGLKPIPSTKTAAEVRADLLARGFDGKLRHLELESKNSDDIGRRVAEYYLGFHRLLNQHVEMAVLYVGKDPLRMSSRFETPSMHFEFRLVDIREFEGEPLLASDDLGDNMLALLTETDRLEVMQRVEEKIRGLPAGQKDDAVRLFVVLSGLRDLEQPAKEIRRQMIDIMENEVLRPAVLKGEIEIILTLLEDKFAAVPDWVLRKLHAADDKQLKDWARRVLRANDLESVFED